MAARGTCAAQNGLGPDVTLNYRVLLGLAGLFMLLLAITTAVQGYLEHGLIVVAFQFVAATLLIYWALADKR